MKKSVIGFYRYNEREKASLLVERAELDVGVDELVRKKGWKAQVEAVAKEHGFDVVSINIAHEVADLDVNIIVSITQKPPALGERKRAVTRGGVAVTGPVNVGKTMAAKRRAAKEAPNR